MKEDEKGIDRAFYDLTVAQRNKAWEEIRILRDALGVLECEFDPLSWQYRQIQSALKETDTPQPGESDTSKRQTE